MTLEQYIRTIPDFPIPGILFRDITPLLAQPAALEQAVHDLCAPFRQVGITHIVCVEARGFIFGALVARELQVPLVLVRKEGKLPYRTIARPYELEYGRAMLEIHEDCYADSQEPRVLFVDDVLATGGTAAATVDLSRQAGGDVVGAAFLIELAGLGGRRRLPGLQIVSVMSY